MRFFAIPAIFFTIFTLSPTIEGLAQVPVTISTDIIKVKGVKLYVHYVKKGETLYSISRAYKVSIEALQKVNPSLNEGLKENTLLYVPVTQQENKGASEKTAETISYQREQTLDTENIIEPPAKRVILQNDNKNIALILPLTSYDGAANTNYMDFYAGALLAAFDLSQSGLAFNFNVINRTPYSSIEGILASQELQKADLIIGPVRSDIISRFIGYSNDTKTPLISPLDPAAEKFLEKGNYLFQAPLSLKAQNTATANMVENLLRNSLSAREEATRVVVVYQDNGPEMEQAMELVNLLDYRGIPCEVIHYSILQGGMMKESFVEKITPDHKNIVVIPSNNEAFVSDAIRNIDILDIPAARITLCGTNRWKGFEALDINLFYKYNLHLAMPYYVDVARKEVKNFIRRFRSLYNTEPSANAFSGYDITTFFVKQTIMGLKETLADYESGAQSSWKIRTLEDALLKGNGLQQNFEFHKNADNQGFWNAATTTIVYNSDYTISTL